MLCLDVSQKIWNVKTYEEWICPVIVLNTMELLNKELPKLKDKITSIHLCFAANPFMCEYEYICNLSIMLSN